MATVLVVDDDREMRHFLVRNLRSRGYDAHSVASIAEALQCVHDGHYDVLLTDQHPEGGDGMELLVALREASPGTRPVFMSANATARESQRALDLGAVRVLGKPFEVDELLTTVERAAEYAGGFCASVHGLSLVDTLQMFHYSRRSLSVRFLGAASAAIHLRDGQLIHAEHGALRGEEALGTILKMPAGSLQTCALDPVPQTIFKDFQAVLLDQLRQLDEHERDSKVPQPVEVADTDFGDLDDLSLMDDDPSSDDAVSTVIRGSAASGARPAVRLPAAKPQTVERIDIACERIVHVVEGAVACAVIDLRTGTLLGIHNAGGSSLAQNEVVAAATVDLFRGPNTSRIESMLRRSGAAEGDSSFEEVQITSKHSQHFAKTLSSGGAVIMLVTHRSTSLGMGWAQLRAAIPIFERLMAPI